MNEIEFEIVLIKEKLEFLQVLEERIKNSATGYEILSNIENFEKKIKKKIIPHLEQLHIYAKYSRLIELQLLIEKIGNGVVLGSTVTYFRYNYKETIEDDRKELNTRLEYLKFKRDQPRE